jgi:hypothetical protein
MPRTCQSCNNIFSTEQNRRAVLRGDSIYRRDYREIELSAKSGCILCQLLLSRHNHCGSAIRGAQGKCEEDNILLFKISARGVTRPPRPHDSMPYLEIEPMYLQPSGTTSVNRSSPDYWYLNFYVYAEAGKIVFSHLPSHDGHS